MRCKYAIKFGVTLHTRCMLNAYEHDKHIGKGLEQFPYQRIEWRTTDRRTYITDRENEFAWDE